MLGSVHSSGGSLTAPSALIPAAGRQNSVQQLTQHLGANYWRLQNCSLPVVRAAGHCHVLQITGAVQLSAAIVVITVGGGRCHWD